MIILITNWSVFTPPDILPLILNDERIISSKIPIKLPKKCAHMRENLQRKNSIF